MTLQNVLPRTIDATECIIGGERFWLIPHGALDGLFAPVVEPAPVEVPPEVAKPEPHPVAVAEVSAPQPVVVPALVQKRGRSPKPDPREVADGEPATVAAQIVALLQKMPMTSGQIIDAMKGRSTTSGVYTVLSDLRRDGLIYTEYDPSDAQRKNTLKEQKAA